ncbi:interferon regulatory factor 3 isoform X3 [Channa argus]|uniref:interferon regulatory factor 3 isoform X3 n=1 Tax=Channa argus TaxID=215402 RepID=UPI0035216CFF
MSHSKPLLIPWLQTQIDSGKYPGVHWTNPERTEFCIPWKHALRQDSSNSDILIFKAWAEISGGGRAQGDPSVWKRNFRSALRAKGFKTLKDNKNDAANPHKVFHWPEKSGSPDLSSGSQDQVHADLLEDCGLSTQESQIDDHLCFPEEGAFSADSTVNHDILQECLKGLNIGPEIGTADFEPPPEQQHLQNQVLIGGDLLPGQQQYPVMFKGPGNEAGLPEQPAHPMGEAEGGVCGGHLAEQFLYTMNKTRDGENFKTLFRISVYYRGVKVSEQLVENEAGVRLVYRPDMIGTVLDHESGLSLVSLPSPGPMLDKIQASLTQRILDKIESLDVGVSGHVVFGQRQGETKAFWSFSKFDQSRKPQEISKLPQPLFTFKEFVQGILAFIDGRDCPPCSLFFCIGEKWPDPDNRPWEKKLITVEVVLTSMELLKNMAVGGGASSLQSVELQMSLEEMMELY